MRYKIEIYQSTWDSQWRWRLKAGNGEIMCQGEPHPTVKLAKEALRRIKLAFPFAKVVVFSAPFIDS